MSSLPAKKDRLRKALETAGRLAIAFSGGVDSTLLAACSAKALGSANVLLVTVATRFVPGWELEEARTLADVIGPKHTVVSVNVDNVENLTDNQSERCYYCKRAVLTAIFAEARLQGFSIVADGSNADDTKNRRPGLKAVSELGAISPLADAGLTKKDVRELSRKLGLPTAEKPAFSCLATRVPYGEKLTVERLERIRKAEEALLPLFPDGLRVRDYLVPGRSGPLALARLEIPKTEIARTSAPGLRRRVVDKLRSAGYTYVTLDLEAIRSGSMDI